jgi:hypothetical protein
MEGGLFHSIPLPEQSSSPARARSRALGHSGAHSPRRRGAVVLGPCSTSTTGTHALLGQGRVAVAFADLFGLEPGDDLRLAQEQLDPAYLF